MRAGSLTYQLALLSPTRLTDRFGSEVVTYATTKTVHAERVSAAGYRSDEAGEHFADYRVQFNIRDVHTVAENWRCQQVGGYLYTIVAIIPNRRRGFNTLICERVNE